MQILTIGAESFEEALGYFDCLRGFRARLVETVDGRHQVKIAMSDDMDIYTVLDAIDRRVAERLEGDRRDLDGVLLGEPVGGKQRGAPA